MKLEIAGLSEEMINKPRDKTSFEKIFYLTTVSFYAWDDFSGVFPLFYRTGAPRRQDSIRPYVGFLS
jgi:hypothetical protein